MRDAPHAAALFAAAAAAALAASGCNRPDPPIGSTEGFLITDTCTCDGSGVTLLPKLAVATETRRSDVAIRPFSAPAPARTIALVWRRGGARALALGKVAEAVRTAVWPAAPNPPSTPSRIAAASRGARPHGAKARPTRGRRAPRR